MQLMPIMDISQDMPNPGTISGISQASGNGSQEFESVLSRQSASERPGHQERANVSKREPEHAHAEKISAREEHRPEQHQAAKRKHLEDRETASARPSGHTGHETHTSKKPAEKSGTDTEDSKLTALMMLMGLLSSNMNQTEQDAGKAADLILSGVFDKSSENYSPGISDLMEKLNKLLGMIDNGETGANIQKELDSIFASLLSSAETARNQQVEGVSSLTAAAADKEVQQNTLISRTEQAASALNAREKAQEQTAGRDRAIKDEKGKWATLKTLATDPDVETEDTTSGLTDSKTTGIPQEKPVQQMPRAAIKPESDKNLMQAVKDQGKKNLADVISESISKAEDMAASAEDQEDSSSIKTIIKPVDSNQEKHAENGKSTHNHDIKVSGRTEPLVTAQADSSRDETNGQAGNDQKNHLVFDFRTDINDDAPENRFTVNSTGNSTSGNVSINHANISGTSSLHTASANSVSEPDASLRSSMLEQLNSGITRTISLNRNRAVIHLNPPELGSVMVRLSVNHNNQIHASFVAEHAHTNQLLQSGMESLRMQLAQNGFELGQVNVHLSGSGMNDANTFHKQQSNDSREGFSHQDTEKDIESVTEIKTARQTIPGYGGRIDVIL